MQKLVVILVLTLCFFSCSEDTSELTANSISFEKVTPETSNVTFTNAIIENDTLNYFEYPYLYLGAGVSIGDINNDGLNDIFFSGNLTSNKLYLNKGNMVFEDITETAGVGAEGKWCSGVTMADINHDGFIDIYVSVSNKFGNGENLLFVNNGDSTFTESASSYGIADTATSIQSTFFDYNNDGLLDLLVANYPNIQVSMGNEYYYNLMQENSLENSGHLYQNNGDGTFSDVTAKAGVQNFGLTLGVVASDLNNDGYKDLYLSNDFNVPDYLYLNNGDGTFSETVKESTSHTSMFGMGLDIADYNNDALMDLIQVDMTANDYKRAKTNMASMSPSTFYGAVALGMHYQYMQNSLQYNNGIDKKGLPNYSDISRYAGISTTDWSWGPLFADFDNDGYKDLFITNGVKRDVNNNDVNVEYSFSALFGDDKKKDYRLLPSTPIPNFAFKNKGDNTFEKVTTAWGLDEKGFSNGVSYGDLDNDGDLDLVLNNLDNVATIYENQSNTETQKFLRIKLKGNATNPLGIGTKVFLETDNSSQVQELTLTRGYQSSVEPIIHFGVNSASSIKEVKVQWPNGFQETLYDVTTNQTLLVDIKNAVEISKKGKQRQQFAEDITESTGINFAHKENDYDDFIHEPLLPHRYSNIGPGVAVADINSDGFDDIFIGNSSGNQAILYLQDEKGNFNEKQGPWLEDKEFEDGGALFFDADGDGDQDLYVASAGYIVKASKQFLQDRLYMNIDGDFHHVKGALPNNPTSNRTIETADYDNDGDLDLFIGGRVVVGKYPFPSSSVLLENQGGKDKEISFKNVNDEIAPMFNSLGMVTAAEWDDFDKDGNIDLIIAGEWMPLRFFKNTGKNFKEVTQETNLGQNVGWWYSLEKVDLNSDGTMEYLAGNLGLNYKYTATLKKPFEVYANDFDENGSMDIVLSYKKDSKNLPLRGRECSSQQVPAIAQRFKTFEAFANANLEDIYGEHMLQNSLHYSATTFKSFLIKKENSTNFKSIELPAELQFSSINDFEVFDYNSDAYPDIILGGNLYDAEVETTRNDASLGLILVGGKDGFSEVISPNESGLFLKGEIRALKIINLSKEDEKGLLVVYNDRPVQLFKLRQYE
ncbi:VCBS repeat-containing protein [Croceitalea marina]|uniref:VCBS repeat-containing protein n=1 Tax=Croceitalea marina TaxID=1775166 RepID=A0ABW5MWG6_9FLAO